MAKWLPSIKSILDLCEYNPAFHLHTHSCEPCKFFPSDTYPAHFQMLQLNLSRQLPLVAHSRHHLLHKVFTCHFWFFCQSLPFYIPCLVRDLVPILSYSILARHFTGMWEEIRAHSGNHNGTRMHREHANSTEIAPKVSRELGLPELYGSNSTILLSRRWEQFLSIYSVWI